MLIANGFITETPSQAFLQVCDRCDGHEVRTTPLPTIATMTYWLSDRGEVYGCQRMKSMCLTKPIRVESRHLGMHPWREEKTVSAFVERR